MQRSWRDDPESEHYMTPASQTPSCWMEEAGAHHLCAAGQRAAGMMRSLIWVWAAELQGHALPPPPLAVPIHALPGPPLPDRAPFVAADPQSAPSSCWTPTTQIRLARGPMAGPWQVQWAGYCQPGG